MGTATDAGAQETATFFSSLSYTTIGIILLITVVALLLITILPRLVRLLLGRFIPDWIDGLTTLLLLLLLLGQAALIIRWIEPGLTFVWPLFLLLTLVIAALLPANPVSDAVAFLRLWRAPRYQVGDWITIGRNQQGRVVALRLLYTELATPTAERVRLPNSVLLRRPITVRVPAPANQPGAASALTTPANTVALPMMEGALLVSATASSLSVAQEAGDARPVVPKVASGPRSLFPPAQLPPLLKRPGLGSLSIKPLLRK